MPEVGRWAVANTHRPGMEYRILLGERSEFSMRRYTTDPLEPQRRKVRQSPERLFAAWTQLEALLGCAR